MHLPPPTWWSSRFSVWRLADDTVQQLEAYRDPAVTAAVRKYWSNLPPRLSSAEKLAEAARIQRVIGGQKAAGDAGRGHALFAQRCAACHRLWSEGGRMGSELTGYERSTPEFWLTCILDPSLKIREGFGAYTLTVTNGETWMGLLVKQDGTGATLRDFAGQTHTARAEEITALASLPVTLMPEGLLSGLTTRRGGTCSRF